MHLPYFFLDEASAEVLSDPIRQPQNHSTRQLAEPMDLNFLNSGFGEASGQKRYKLVPASFSLIICGFGHHQWTGYGFGYNDLAVPLQAQPVEEHPLSDPIAGVIGTGTNIPVWDPLTTSPDPREYFLLALCNRSLYTLKKWRNINLYFKSRINKYVRLIAQTYEPSICLIIFTDRAQYPPASPNAATPWGWP